MENCLFTLFCPIFLDLCHFIRVQKITTFSTAIFSVSGGGGLPSSPFQAPLNKFQTHTFKHVFGTSDSNFFTSHILKFGNIFVSLEKSKLPKSLKSFAYLNYQKNFLSLQEFSGCPEEICNYIKYFANIPNSAKSHGILISKFNSVIMNTRDKSLQVEVYFHL